ncbi:MAG: malectin domain-containing carbohydrate-binding protein [Capsulimonadaceae bacterium]
MNKRFALFLSCAILSAGLLLGGMSHAYAQATAIACGSTTAYSPYVADTDFSGGGTSSWTTTTNTTLLSTPVPPAGIFQQDREGTFTYTIPNLTANAAYSITMYFVENYFTAAGDRVFSVTCNGTTVISNLDVYATAGARYKAIQKTFNGTASSSGQLVFGFTASVNQAKCGGIAIFTSGAPAAPTGLTATAGNAQVALAWTASSGATSYNVYRGTATGDESATAIATGVTTASYTNTGLTNGTAYYFKVAALNATGTSAQSNEASATPSAGAPAAPTGLTATAGNGQVALAWTASSGATSYNVYRGTATGGESATAIATGITTTSYTNTGLTNGTAYYFKVAALNASGTSAQSTEASATPTSGVPAAPTGVTATPGNAQVALAWTASSGATSYNVYRGTATGGESATAIATGVTTTSYTNTGLTNGTEYFYKVAALNASGTSAQSTEVSATPSTGTGTLVLGINCGGSATGSWVADEDFSGGTETTVTTTVSTTGVTNPAPEAVYQSNRFGGCTYTITGLTASGAYTVRLHFAETYFDAAGDRESNVSINGTQVLTDFDIWKTAGGENIATIQPFAATASSSGQIVIGLTTVVNNAQINGIEIDSTTGSAPLAPTNLTATQGNTVVSLSWTASSGATSYNLYRSTTSGGEGTTAYQTGITATSYTDTGLNNSTEYYYTVAALNSYGTSPQSTQATATPTGAPPAAPTGLTAGQGNGLLTLSWTASAGATSYNIYRGTTSGGESATAQVTGITATSYTDTTVTNGITYYYKAAALNSYGTSPLSTEASGTPSSNPYSAGISINCGGVATGNFVTDCEFDSGTTTSWTATVATNLLTGSIPPQAVLDTDREGTFSYNIAGLTPSTNYPVVLYFVEQYFTASGDRVFSVTANGTTEISNLDIYATAGANTALEETFTVASTSTGDINLVFTPSVNAAKCSAIVVGAGTLIVSAAPTGLTASPGNAQNTLTWTPSVGETYTNLYRGTSSGGESATPVATDITATTYIDTGLTNSTTYYYKVAAVNGAGTSGYSSEVSAEPLSTYPVPAVPTGVVATGGYNTARLAWNSSPGTTAYSIFRGTASGAESTTAIGTATGTTYADNGAQNGKTYYYKLNAGNANGISALSAEVTASPTAGSGGTFTMSAAPASDSVAPGNTVAFTISTAGAGGFAGQVSMSVTGLPGTGVTANFTQSPVGTGFCVMDINAASTAGAGTYNLTITGTSGSLKETAAVTVTVTAAPVANFTLTATPSTQTIGASQSALYNVLVTPTGGLNQEVNMTATGLPTGAVASFTMAGVVTTVDAGVTSMMITTSATTPQGTYPITITGTCPTNPAGTLTQTYNVTLVVSAPPAANFSLAVTPNTQSVVVCGPNTVTTLTVTATATGGFDGIIGLSATPLPGGAIASFDPPLLTGSGTSTMTIQMDATTQIQTTTVEIMGVSGNIEQTVPLSLTTVAAPANNFQLAASPSTIDVNAGSDATYTITGSEVGTFTGTIALTTGSLPAGVTATFNPATITPTGSSTLTLTSTTSVPPYDYLINVYGTSGSLEQFTAVLFVVGNTNLANAVDVVNGMTLADKTSQLTGLFDTNDYRVIPGLPALNIPGLNITNGACGAAAGGPGHQGGAVALPTPTSIAATWDPSQATIFGGLIGKEVHYFGNGLVEGPTMDLARNPQGGRTFEAFGEDPFLAGQIAVADVNGIQGKGVIAQAKHFMGNDQEAYRANENDIVDERTQHELLMSHFQTVVTQGQVGAIMCSYNEINGAYDCQDQSTVGQYLKDTWGLNGFVGPDFGAIHSQIDEMVDQIDMDMPGQDASGDASWEATLQGMVAAGQVPTAYIDDKLVRRYSTMMRMGVYQNPPVTTCPGGGDCSMDQTTAATDMGTEIPVAEAGMVLLKNTGNILPLNPANITSIALIGPEATHAYTGGGGTATVSPVISVNPEPGIATRAGTGVQVILNDGSDVASAQALAKACSVVILMVGDTESEGADRDTLSLDDLGVQDALITAVAPENPNTVVVLKTGSAVTMPWLSSVPAILEAWYPGSGDGTATAAVLFGDYNPSGKLPITFPATQSQEPASTPAQYPGLPDSSGFYQVEYSEGVFQGYRWFDQNDLAPNFPFGFGLSYTTFAFSDLGISPATTSFTNDPTNTVTVTFNIKNTGTVTGADVGELYLGMPAPSGSVPQPPKQLKGFQKLTLTPGQTGTATITLNAQDFSYWDVVSHSWLIQTGTYNVMVGDSSRNILLTGTITLD